MTVELVDFAGLQQIWLVDYETGMRLHLATKCPNWAGRLAKRIDHLIESVPPEEVVDLVRCLFENPCMEWQPIPTHA